jgi:hypothetical protein
MNFEVQAGSDEANLVLKDNEFHLKQFLISTSFFFLVLYVISSVFIYLFSWEDYLDIMDHLSMAITCLFLVIELRTIDTLLIRSNSVHVINSIFVMTKLLLIAVACIYYSYTNATWFNILHNVATFMMFGPLVVIQEMEVCKISKFKNSFTCLYKYYKGAKSTKFSEDLIFDELESYKLDLTKYAKVSGHVVSVVIVMSLIMSLIFLSYSYDASGSSIEDLVFYATHYFLVFSAVEGSIRRVSDYNDLLFRITNSINYNSSYEIFVFNIKPSKTMLISFYISLFISVFRLILI